MKPILLALLPLLAAAATSPEIDALIAAASAAPAEFQADSLIRISSLETLEKARRVELLSQAFDRASAAQQPYRRTIAVTRVAGPVGAVNKAYAQDLDALSLRLRAVEGMLALDAGKARQLFARIPPLQLPKAACTDFLVYDVRRYYDVLERIVRAADASEKRVILEGAAAAIASPVQVGPMARVLTFADVPDETFTAGIVAFGAAMAKISGDDRSFTFAHQVGREIESLTDECRRRKVSPLRMLEGYRVYLVFNLSGARCLSDAIQAGGLAAFATVETAQAPMNPVGHFNEKLQTA